MTLPPVRDVIPCPDLGMFHKQLSYHGLSMINRLFMKLMTHLGQSIKVKMRLEPSLDWELGPMRAGVDPRGRVEKTTCLKLTPTASKVDSILD